MTTGNAMATYSATAIPGRLRAWMRRLASIRRERRDILQTEGLSDHLLRDIGLTRDRARYAVRYDRYG